MMILKYITIFLFVILLSSCSDENEYSKADIVSEDIHMVTFLMEQVEFIINTENISIEKIVVFENDGVMIDEMNEMPDNFVEVDVDYELIKSDLVSILENLNGSMVCSGIGCTSYGPIPDIVITCTDGENSFDFKIDNQGTTVFIRGGSSLMENCFEFSFSNQYLLELSRIYDLIVDEYSN